MAGQPAGQAGQQAGQQAAAEAQRAARADEHTRRVLHERAAALARPPAAAEATTSAVEVLTFSVAGQRYAVASSHVREVVRRPDVRRLGEAQAAFVGVVNVRGEIVPVTELTALTGAPAAHSASRVVVLDGAGPPLGILVDEVHDILALRRDQIARRADAGEAAALVVGVTPDLVLLDGAALLTDHRLFIHDDRSV